MTDTIVNTATAPIDSAGRIVLPREIRAAMKLEAGMRLRLAVRAGKLELTVAEDEAPVSRAASGRRVLPPAAAASDAAAAVRAERRAQAQRRR